MLSAMQFAQSAQICTSRTKIPYLQKFAATFDSTDTHMPQICTYTFSTRVATAYFGACGAFWISIVFFFFQIHSAICVDSAPNETQRVDELLLRCVLQISWRIRATWEAPKEWPQMRVTLPWAATAGPACPAPTLPPCQQLFTISTILQIGRNVELGLEFREHCSLIGLIGYFYMRIIQKFIWKIFNKK